MTNQKGDGSTMPPAMRKGPWMEEEDAQLVRFVRLFGERRWDFLAKVSGLRRTGKSCRLRWVNYLHPGLRRGRITPDEERLILQLHAQWGSKWSRIARTLPGRTDNEIKNFWRTRTRKKALQDRRQRHHSSSNGKAASASSPSSSSVASDSCPGSPNSGAATSSSGATESSALQEGSGGSDEEASTTPATTTAASQHHQEQEQEPEPESWYTMDQLWNWNEVVAASYMVDGWGWGGADHGAPAADPPSPVWELYTETDCWLWRIDDEEYYKKMLDAS